MNVLLAAVIYNLFRMTHQLMSLDCDVIRENEHFFIIGICIRKYLYPSLGFQLFSDSELVYFFKYLTYLYVKYVYV